MINIVLITIGVASLCCLIHYVIGSPKGAEYFGGRPLSFYGRFITKLYAKHEDKENNRLDSKKAAVKVKLDTKFEKIFKEVAPNDFNAYILIAQNEYDKEMQAIEHQYRPNLANMLGCCTICFFTWVSLISWVILLFILNANLLLLFLLVPTSVIIANKIQL